MSEINVGDLEDDEELLDDDAGTADDGGDPEPEDGDADAAEPDGDADADPEAEETPAEEAEEAPEEEAAPSSDDSAAAIAAAIATPRAELEGQILDNAAGLVGSILKDIDPDYRNKMTAYRSEALTFVQANKPALVGMAWKTLKGIVEVRARGGFTEEERVEVYRGMSIGQLNQLQKQNVQTIGGWADERMKQLAIYEKAKAQLSEKASNLLLKGLTILIA